MSSSRLATRDRRASVLLLLTLTATFSVLGGTKAPPAQAYSWGWPTWLAGHPTLTVTEMPKGFITGPSSQVAKAASKTPTGALAAGAFVLGYEGTTAFLNWQFGPDGDVRSYVSGGNFLRHDDATTVVAEPGTVGQGIECTGLHPACVPPFDGTWTGGVLPVAWTDVATDAGMWDQGRFWLKCQNGTAAPVWTGSNTSAWGNFSVGCGQGGAGESGSTLREFRLKHNSATGPDDGPTWVRWFPDVPEDWTVYVTQHCRGESGPGTSTSSPHTITPTANGTAELEVPACPAGMQPEAVSLDGGRAGDEGGILVAIPNTRTQEAEVTPPPPNTDPVEPVPGTIGAGSTVHNPDGSVTVVQTQTLPDGTTRTVTTTTHPDGSRTVTTQPLNPDGTPNGAPAVVTIPGTMPGDEAAAVEDGCSFGLKPWLWPFRALKCAFIPSPGTFDKLGELRDAFVQHPPGSVLVGGGQLVGGLGVALSDSSCGGVGPDFSPEGYEGMMQLPSWCNGSGFGGIDLLYAFVTVCLYAATMWSLWHLAESHFGVGMEA